MFLLFRESELCTLQDRKNFWEVIACYGVVSLWPNNHTIKTQ